MTTENASRPTPPNAPILAAVDGSASSYQAVAWAAAEAALHRCPLHIITSMAVPPGFGPGSQPAEADLKWLRRDGERVLTEATRVARTAAPGEEPAITTEVSFELVIPLLIERSAQARMLVVGSRGLGAFQRGVLGSVSTATTHHAHCPVAVIHGISAIDAVSARQPVLVGVDGTGNSVPAVELAFEEAPGGRSTWSRCTHGATPAAWTYRFADGMLPASRRRRSWPRALRAGPTVIRTSSSGASSPRIVRRCRC